MSAISKLKKSRESWKAKAVSKAKNVRYLQKQNQRIKKEREHYKIESAQLKKSLQRLQENASHKPYITKTELIYMAMQLFLIAGISFRGVSKVLSVLAAALGIKKAPSHQTIINWLLKLSIVKMQSTTPVQRASHTPHVSFSIGYAWMVDLSIGLGIGKILTVLALPLNHHKDGRGAPKLSEIQCLGVSVAPSWNGEKIAELLKRIIAIHGCPSAYLKDGGTDLEKSARLLSEEGLASLCIDDVSHKIANLLKHKYKDHPLFQTFLSACGKVSKNLKQTILACLAPPKVSVKARFMNLNRLICWADKILKHSPAGKAEEGSLLSKLRTKLDKLPKCRAFITQVMRDVEALMQCQKIIKNKGLTQETYEACKKYLNIIPHSSSIYKGFNQWAEDHLKIADMLGVQTGLPISSDQIESLFAVGKRHGTGEIKDANRIGMRIPSFCGAVTKEDAESIQKITTKDLQETMTSKTITGQRRAILSNPGMLETLGHEEKQDYFELISGPKKWSKTAVKPHNTGLLEKIIGPPLLEFESGDAAA